MKKKGLLKVTLLITMAGLSFSVQAPGQTPPARTQDSFACKAPIDTITRAGFYRIILTPEVLARCNRDLSDIRISRAGSWPSHIQSPVPVGSANVTPGVFIPYVLRTDFPNYQGESFIEFPILPAQKGDSTGDVRIGNWSGGTVGSLVLQISPSASTRNWTLSGSNDGKKWFAIKEHIQALPPASDLPNYEMVLKFPPGNYHYFKITQEDKDVFPLNIIRAGIITQHAGVRRYRSVPPPVISQKDSSDHHSYITISFRQPYLVEHLTLHVKSPKFFNRSGFLFDDEKHPLPDDIVLAPDRLSFDIGPVRSRSLLLDISNEDNTPLVLDKVEASQLERYLLTWLEPGKYELLVGDKHALTPKYDLRYFVDTVSQEPAALMPGPLTSTNIYPLTPAKSSRNYKGIYLWTAIIVVLILLIRLCLNMLRSIRESRE
ncbi:MAG TPA: hypothetical protein VHC96_20655 [Puia sp.]|jgi:hypothetical protein|nr:hypothetical protein [Puia sp.]